jgi:hypothetical protein
LAEGWRRPGIIVLLAAVVASCGGPVVANSSPPLQGPVPAASSVPAPSSYGHGAWAFTVSFLAPPTHTGVGKTPKGSVAVAMDTYRARFRTNVGAGMEQLRIIEQPRVLTGPCVLRSLVPVRKGSCPKPHGDILSTGVVGCPRHVSILGIVCHGYVGILIAARGKMAYQLQVVAVTQGTARAVLDTFVPGGK